MTRRFGYWIIGSALAMAPLAGCAQWGRPSASRDGDCVDPMTFGNRQVQSRAAGNALPPPDNHAATNETVITRTPGADGSRGSAPPAPPTERAEAPAMVTAAAGPLLPPTPLVGLPPKSAAAPPRLEIQSFPIAPVAAQVDPVRREPLVEALDCFFENRYNDALQFLQKYDQPTQEIALRLLPVLKLMTQKSIDQFSADEVAVLDDWMQSFWDSLRPRSQLSIAKACFCESILSFGVYKEMPEGHAFQGATPNRQGEFVQIYAEVRNFASEAKNGFYVTRLASSVEIRDQKGVPVWSTRFADEKAIRSRTRLHDYCNKYSFYLPNNLAAGTYTLSIHVTDQTQPEQPREATKTLELHVTSMSARVP